MAGRLVMFFGIECEHCHDMDPLVEKLEKERGFIHLDIV